MDTEAFIARVVPPGNNYVISWQIPGRHWSNRAFRTAGEAASFARWTTGKGWDTYHACASYRLATVDDRGALRVERTQANAAELQALFLDLDCKRPDGAFSKPTAYENRAQALEALSLFINNTGIPRPTLIVDSGYGWHIYWILDRAIPRGEWEVLAHALADAADESALRFDRGCVIDAARVLRPAGAKNFKQAGAPRDVRVVRAAQTNIPLEDMRAALQAFMGRAAGLQRQLSTTASARPAVDNSALTAGVYNNQRRYFAQPILNACAVLAQVAATHGAGQSYEFWRDTLNLIAYTVDGDQWAVPLSDGYSGYNATELAKQWDYTKRTRDSGTKGPTLCDTFARHNAAACATCPHRGLIRSPIVLGVENDELPPRFERADGRIWTRVPSKEEGKPDERVLVSPYDVQEFIVQRHPEFGYWISFRAVLPGRPPIRVEFGLSELPERAGAATRFLARHHMVFDDDVRAGLFRRFVMSFVAHLKRLREIQEYTHHPFGWSGTDQNPGFAVAGTIYTPDRVMEEPGKVDPTVAKIYSAHGSHEKWKQSAGRIVQDFQPALQTLVSVAFAAPLVPFTGHQGMLIAATSTESGVGKSTATRIAQSVWGDPVVGVHGLDDTQMSVARKLSIIANLPAFWDEIHIKADIDKFINLVFKLGQGKEKTRLNRDAELREVTSFQTLLCAALNGSVLDHMVENVQGTDAGFLRVFQFTVEKRVATRSFLDVQREVAELNTNHGTAGRVYAQWLVRNRARAKADIAQVQTYLERRFKPTQEERFWIAAASVLILGAAYASKLELLPINARAVKSFVLDTFEWLRNARCEAGLGGRPGDVMTNQQTLEIRILGILNDFLRENAMERLVTEKMPMGRGRFGGPGVIVPGFPRAGYATHQIATVSGAMRVSRKALKTWLYSRGIQYEAFIADLRKVTNIITSHAVIGAGTPFATIQMPTVDIPLTGPLASLSMKTAQAPEGTEQEEKGDE